MTTQTLVAAPAAAPATASPATAAAPLEESPAAQPDRPAGHSFAAARSGSEVLAIDGFRSRGRQACRPLALAGPIALAKHPGALHPASVGSADGGGPRLGQETIAIRV